MEVYLPAAGDLGAIDKQYDVAVSTACAALDYMVVEDTTAAQRCVELLRKRNLGVATFLLLDKQRHLAKSAAERANPPEGTETCHSTSPLLGCTPCSW